MMNRRRRIGGHRRRLRSNTESMQPPPKIQKLYHSQPNDVNATASPSISEAYPLTVSLLQTLQLFFQS
eukprot:CAMPEP_0197071958 /NCGR_PEP_ID=MMETSP1384-20130603/209849_1 /TAXON_ID=29189 /ORGANISM="Ammonia sp." /LENGTH=67 /DNA_ID=CAMNT_0042510767 /DNA_START=23 /DNA_END=222 /DNA_ORIENTATION=-